MRPMIHDFSADPRWFGFYYADAHSGAVAA